MNVVKYLPSYGLPQACFTSLFHKPSKINAAIRGVRYKLFRAWNPIAAHSIIELAMKLDGARVDEENAGSC
jgi:hypothetical protein